MAESVDARFEERVMSVLRKVLAVAAGVALLAAPLGAAVAQELKIGYISLERLLRDSSPARAAGAWRVQ